MGPEEDSQRRKYHNNANTPGGKKTPASAPIPLRVNSIFSPAIRMASMTKTAAHTIGAKRM